MLIQQIESLARLLGMAPLRRVVTYQLGMIPPEADFYQEREIRLSREVGVQVLTGLGGVGKTQLAGVLARRLRDAGVIDILPWISAGSRSAVTAAFARAARRPDRTGRGEHPSHRFGRTSVPSRRCSTATPVSRF